MRWYSPRDWQDTAAAGETGSGVVFDAGGDALLREEKTVASPTEPSPDVAPTTGSDERLTGSEWAGSNLEQQTDKADSRLLHEESDFGEGDGWEWDVVDDGDEGTGEACSEGDRAPLTWVRRGVWAG